MQPFILRKPGFGLRLRGSHREAHMIIVALAVHILAALFWVGGMAFAYMVLRPAAGPLEPPARLKLWRGVFERFLPWVGIGIALLLISGYGMVFLVFGGFANLPLHVNVMQGLGIIMILLYLHLYFAPWPRFRAAVDRSAPPEAAKQLNQIRIIVAVNLVLGVIVVIVGATGRYW
jgi:uncharacterized membrane protein